ncbi:hypothetical protein ULF88_16580 [Halopseudomonas pachastrellae]|nr:hypothetical protein [Halopseudomonas pachastrellae]
MYYNQLQITLDPAALPADTRSLNLGFQGCADAGLVTHPRQSVWR